MGGRRSPAFGCKDPIKQVASVPHHASCHLALRHSFPSTLSQRVVLDLNRPPLIALLYSDTPAVLRKPGMHHSQMMT